MDQKFTIRDLLVYFITGFLFCLVFAITYLDYLNQSILPTYKEISDIFGFTSLAIFYVIGKPVC